jgi:hypothetical protein
MKPQAHSRGYFRHQEHFAAVPISQPAPGGAPRNRKQRRQQEREAARAQRKTAAQPNKIN